LARAVLPPPPELLRYPVLARWVSDFRRRVNVGVGAYGGRVAVTSWWRSSARNAAAGGAALSQHLLGLAVDLVAGSPLELARALERAGVVVVVERDHVHAQSARAGIWDAVIREALRRRLI
jgi:hypothetical protein